jgi:hypothetical protein
MLNTLHDMVKLSVDMVNVSLDMINVSYAMKKFPHDRVNAH